MGVQRWKPLGGAAYRGPYAPETSRPPARTTSLGYCLGHPHMSVSVVSNRHTRLTWRLTGCSQAETARATDGVVLAEYRLTWAA